MSGTPIDSVDPRYEVTISEADPAVTTTTDDTGTTYVVQVQEGAVQNVTVATAGSPGLDGVSLLSGAGPPSDAFGAPGSWYLDTTNNHLYGPKGETTWPATYVALTAQTNETYQFGRSGTLKALAGQSRLMLPFSGTVQGVRATVGTAPTGTPIIVDVNKNGTTIFTTQANRPTIAIAANDSGAEKTPDVTSFVAGDYFTCDVDQVGTGTAGADLLVIVRLSYNPV